MTREEFIKTCVDGNYCTEEKAKHYNGSKTELDVFDLAAVYDNQNQEPPKRVAHTGNRTIFKRECGGKKVLSGHYYNF